ncbi:MAG TPA: DUF167 family protein [Candidatus Competibacteraceae bacterium]|nr:MAG: YggU family protein [Candidatus Competibacteraceae bacterium]HOB62263.1 DUF167 family protein [Candidatus Competibacteraceae bacterium]HQA25549.1 DUF167 family protein [Candidatus Competibacteraceae bacterium]HQD56539.1 DUF167 family protein [Candidatus Competibacteraceae bacterium]
MNAGDYAWDGADLILRIRVQPRASRDEWLEPRDQRFRARITAPPVDGKANAHLQRFLAELFGVAKSQVALLAGETGRDKRWRIAAPRCLPPGIDWPAAPGRS